jgi:hypothetical protein
MLTIQYIKQPEDPYITLNEDIDDKALTNIIDSGLAVAHPHQHSLIRLVDFLY